MWPQKIGPTVVFVVNSGQLNGPPKIDNAPVVPIVWGSSVGCHGSSTTKLTNAVGKVETSVNVRI